MTASEVPRVPRKNSRPIARPEADSNANGVTSPRQFKHGRETFETDPSRHVGSCRRKEFGVVQTPSLYSTSGSEDPPVSPGGSSLLYYLALGEHSFGTFWSVT